MKEKIVCLKELYDNGIDENLFFKLISNSTNSPTDQKLAYSNLLTIKEWQELYAADYLNISVSENQLALFFNYMTKYSSNFFGKMNGKYFVNKYFTNEEKKREKFQFELIVYKTIELVKNI